ncbi:hypothetical protein LEP1GSC102_0317 [Leptospira interrogans str. UI 09600]|nr:hypothetical protein LEP1GSC069_1966 [Leptospira interrogans serovar Canicola str. Fiocruz LV133]EMN75230.1 hypothetical protein LEP1GSC102_0317 [Leptospira interrogans str. UI 09600]
MQIDSLNVGTTTKFRFICKIMCGNSRRLRFYEQILKL